MSDSPFTGLAIKVVTPSAHLHWRTAGALCQSLVELTRVGIPLEISIISGEDSLDNAKNQAAAQFLASNQSHLLLVRDGMVWTQADILRLLRAKRDVVGGVHVAPGSPARFRLIPQVSEENQASIEQNCLKVDFVGSEFVLFSRDALVRLTERLPAESAYQIKSADGSTLSVLPLFATTVRDGAALASDYLLCEAWREEGGDVWAEISTTVARISEASFQEPISKLLVFNEPLEAKEPTEA